MIAQHSVFTGCLKVLNLVIVNEKYLTLNLSKEPNISCKILDCIYIFQLSGIFLPYVRFYYVITCTSQTSKPKEWVAEVSNPSALMLYIRCSNIPHWLPRRWYACFIPHIIIMGVLAKSAENVETIFSNIFFK